MAQAATEAQPTAYAKKAGEVAQAAMQDIPARLFDQRLQLASLHVARVVLDRDLDGGAACRLRYCRSRRPSAVFRGQERQNVGRLSRWHDP